MRRADGKSLSKWSILGLWALTIAIIGVGIWLIVDNVKNKEYYVSTEATIVAIYDNSYYDASGTYVSDYDVYVDYEAEGQYFEDILLGRHDITMYVGKSVSIVYDSRTPTKLVLSKFPIGGVACSVFGGILLIALVMEMITSKKKSKDDEPLGNREKIDY